jgi:hypothetical protein
MNTAYDQFQGAAKQLYNRSITFYEPAHKRNGKPLPPTRVQMRWVGSVKYQDGEGWVELAWWPDLLRHLTGLQRQFTTYQLQQASALRSGYSWKLLELLMRFESTGWAEYTIEDFKASMDAPPSLSDFGQVKRRIIDPAVELTEKDGWLISGSRSRRAARSRLRFTFMRDPQGQLRSSGSCLGRWRGTAAAARPAARAPARGAGHRSSCGRGWPGASPSAWRCSRRSASSSGSGAAFHCSPRSLQPPAFISRWAISEVLGHRLPLALDALLLKPLASASRSWRAFSFCRPPARPPWPGSASARR